MKGTGQITVGKIIKDLRRFGKACPNANVRCCLPDGTMCLAVGVFQDEDREVCIRFEEGEEDSGCHDVDMMVADLEGYDSRSRVYMEACGLYLTFNVFHDGEIFSYDDDEDFVRCDGETIGEYEEPEYDSGWLSEADRRDQAEKARKERREERTEYVALLILTVIVACGFAYNAWAAVTRSGDTLTGNIFWSMICLFLSIIGSMTLYYDNR